MPEDVSVISFRSATMGGEEGVKNGGGSEGRVPSELGSGGVEPLTNEARVSGESEVVETDRLSTRGSHWSAVSIWKKYCVLCSLTLPN